MKQRTILFASLLAIYALSANISSANVISANSFENAYIKVTTIKPTNEDIEKFRRDLKSDPKQRDPQADYGSSLDIYFAKQAIYAAQVKHFNEIIGTFLKDLSDWNASDDPDKMNHMPEMPLMVLPMKPVTIPEDRIIFEICRTNKTKHTEKCENLMGPDASGQSFYVKDVLARVDSMNVIYNKTVQDPDYQIYMPTDIKNVSEDIMFLLSTRMYVIDAIIPAASISYLLSVYKLPGIGKYIALVAAAASVANSIHALYHNATAPQRNPAWEAFYMFSKNIILGQTVTADIMKRPDGRALSIPEIAEFIADFLKVVPPVPQTLQ